MTTSSCAGRVSVFLEGRKKGGRIRDGGKRDGDMDGQSAVPGGKGMGGRWLFVSHEPVDLRRSRDSLSGLLGLKHSSEERSRMVDREPHGLRLARFQFEPMVCRSRTFYLRYAVAPSKAITLICS